MPSIYYFRRLSMFIKISNINFFVNPEDKTPIEIFYEIFNRMNVTSITNDQKTQMIESIREQLENEMLQNNIFRSV